VDQLDVCSAAKVRPPCARRKDQRVAVEPVELGGHLIAPARTPADDRSSGLMNTFAILVILSNRAVGSKHRTLDSTLVSVCIGPHLSSSTPANLRKGPWAWAVGPATRGTAGAPTEREQSRQDVSFVGRDETHLSIAIAHNLNPTSHGDHTVIAILPFLPLPFRRWRIA